MPLLSLFALVFCAATARPCGPDFPVAVFAVWPDGAYPSFVAGHVGVPLGDHARTRDLVIAYDALTHTPLTPADQKQAIAVNRSFQQSWADTDTSNDPPPPGLNAWIAARNAISLDDGMAPTLALPLTRAVPGNSYEGITNCLDDAFANAARTLTARAAAFGKQSPAVLAWVRGQDAVFTNCGDGKAPEYFGPGQPPPPPPAPRLPEAAPTSAPRWLQQDRAYQLAAAHFYALDFDAAIAGFRAIAADTASPWSSLAAYLVARANIRKATIADATGDIADPDRAKAQALAAAQKARTHADLGLAQKQLLSLRADPRMAPLQIAVADLLDYVNLRYDPDAQAVVLATRLHSPATPNFGQSLIDLTYLRYGPYDEVKTIGDSADADDRTGMLAWIKALTTPDPKLALAQWRSTHTSAWLLAAITLAQSGDPAVPDLLHAAEALPATDPAYTAVAYHRLRLGPRTPAARALLLGIVPHIDTTGAPTTTNLFTALNAATAPTLEDWLRAAPRTPTAAGNPEIAVVTPPQSTPAGDTPPPPTLENVCGHKANSANFGQLFDVDAAIALNEHFPLRLLAAAAESSVLPENLRFQVAQAAWARAVLLDLAQPSPVDEAIARRMAPVLFACRATWKPVLDAYNAAVVATASPAQEADRRATALLALMRFASTEPSVRQGEERRGGFATYDEFRQNWWCSTVPLAGGDVDEPPDSPTSVELGPDVDAHYPPPPFLTHADLAEAQAEIAVLRKVPNASTYFAQQALAWMKLHPSDPRTPDILGEADRVLRNSCRTEQPFDPHTGKPTGDPNDMNFTPNLARALFEALHTHYPTSSWAKRYKSWE